MLEIYLVTEQASRISNIFFNKVTFTIFKRFKEDKIFDEFLIDFSLVPLHSSDV